MSEWFKLAGLIVVIGMFAFMIFGPRNRVTRAISVLLLVGINLAFVVFSYHVWTMTGSLTLWVLMLGGWFILQKYCHDTTAPPRIRRHLIIAERGATRQEIARFYPQFYFRLVRRNGWRRIELEIDEDGLEIPDAEPIPVQVVADWHNTYRMRKQGMIPDQWCGVIFEYRDQVFYGMMRY